MAPTSTLKAQKTALSILVRSEPYVVSLGSPNRRFMPIARACEALRIPLVIVTRPWHKNDSLDELIQRGATIKRLWTEPGLAERFGDAAHDRAERSWTLQAVAVKFSELTDRVLRR